MKFPKEVASFPYSTRFETAEGTQHFRIIHNRQVKTCQLGMNPDHILKDCPEFQCYKCEQQGHFARDCRAVKCPDCQEILDKCQCWMGGESKQEEEQREVGGQMQDEMEQTRNKEQQEETTAEKTEENIRTVKRAVSVRERKKQKRWRNELVHQRWN